MELDRPFFEKLWDGEKVLYLKCNKDYLVPLHIKRKNNDSKYPNCKKVYRTIGILNNLLKENK